MQGKDVENAMYRARLEGFSVEEACRLIGSDYIQDLERRAFSHPYLVDDRIESMMFMAQKFFPISNKDEAALKLVILDAVSDFLHPSASL